MRREAPAFDSPLLGKEGGKVVLGPRGLSLSLLLQDEATYIQEIMTTADGQMVQHLVTAENQVWGWGGEQRRAESLGGRGA